MAGLPALIVGRASGDHVMVSTDPDVLADIGEIALNWIDLTLYKTKAASDASNGTDGVREP